MVLLSPQEIIDIVIMTVFVGFIFSDIFGRYHHKDTSDPIAAYTRPLKSERFENFKFAALVTAPAIILHEFGHKFVAIAFGLHATFHAAYTWLGIGLLLKLMNFGFIFFVPAYVSYPALATPFQSMLIAGAGPFVNLAIWLGTAAYIKSGKAARKHLTFFALTSKINMFLFFFNMIPIPPFDGFHFFNSLWHTIKPLLV